MAELIEECWEGPEALDALEHILRKAKDPTNSKKIQRVVFSWSGSEIKLLLRVDERILGPLPPAIDDTPLEQMDHTDTDVLFRDHTRDDDVPIP